VVVDDLNIVGAIVGPEKNKCAIGRWSGCCAVPLGYLSTTPNDCPVVSASPQGV